MSSLGKIILTPSSVYQVELVRFEYHGKAISDVESIRSQVRSGTFEPTGYRAIYKRVDGIECEPIDLSHWTSQTSEEKREIPLSCSLISSSRELLFSIPGSNLVSFACM